MMKLMFRMKSNRLLLIMVRLMAVRTGSYLERGIDKYFCQDIIK